MAVGAAPAQGEGAVKDACNTFPWAVLIQTPAIKRRIKRAEGRRRRYLRSHFGEKNGNAKLSDAQVEQLRLSFSNGMSRKEISVLMDIPLSTVKSIISGRTRKRKG